MLWLIKFRTKFKEEEESEDVPISKIISNVKWKTGEATEAAMN